jgi:hypothetical protein
MTRRWRTKKPCEDCPFNRSGPGLRLRKSLGPSRWREITTQMLQGQKHFICHKTSDETGNGSNLICAGSINFQEKHNTSSNLQRVMERIERLVR